MARLCFLTFAFLCQTRGYISPPTLMLCLIFDRHLKGLPAPGFNLEQGEKVMEEIRAKLERLGSRIHIGYGMHYVCQWLKHLSFGDVGIRLVDGRLHPDDLHPPNLNAEDRLNLLINRLSISETSLSQIAPEFHNMSIDETQMIRDEEVIGHWAKAQSPIFQSLVIKERSAESISTLRSFLVNPSLAGDDVRTAGCYIVGHGISVDSANSIRQTGQVCQDDQGNEWLLYYKWHDAPVFNMHERAGNPRGMGVPLAQMIPRVLGGSLMVGSAGYITPDWVFQCLRQRDAQQALALGLSQPFIFLLLDSCYSGGFVDHIAQMLRDNPLEQIALVFQSAADSDQKVQGKYLVDMFTFLNPHPPLRQEADTHTIQRRLRQYPFNACLLTYSPRAGVVVENEERTYDFYGVKFFVTRGRRQDM